MGGGGRWGGERIVRCLRSNHSHKIVVVTDNVVPRSTGRAGGGDLKRISHHARKFVSSEFTPDSCPTNEGTFMWSSTLIKDTSDIVLSKNIS